MKLATCTLLLAAIIGITGCASPRIYSDIKPGQEFPPRWLTKKTTIAQIESEITAAGASVKEEWFAEWQTFLSKHHPEIEVWEFADEWSFDASLVGYVLIRNGRMVDSIGGIRMKEKKQPNKRTTDNSGAAPLRV